MRGGLTLNGYQQAAKATQLPSARNAWYLLTGLTAEVGEVMDVVAKKERDGMDPAVYFDRMHKELGDVLWFVAALADYLGLSLEDVGQRNLDKLTSRMHKGTLQGSGDDR